MLCGYHLISIKYLKFAGKCEIIEGLFKRDTVYKVVKEDVQSGYAFLSVRQESTFDEGCDKRVYRGFPLRNALCACGEFCRRHLRRKNCFCCAVRSLHRRRKSSGGILVRCRNESEPPGWSGQARACENKRRMPRRMALTPRRRRRFFLRTVLLRWEAF